MEIKETVWRCASGHNADHKVRWLNRDSREYNLIYEGIKKSKDWNLLSGTLPDVLQICDACYKAYRFNIAVAAIKQSRQDALSMVESSLKHHLEVKDGKEKAYWCNECYSIWDKDELVQVRYCEGPQGDCGTAFSGTDYGRNCEQCNRPFTRNICESGCPDCLAEESEDLCEATEKQLAEVISDEREQLALIRIKVGREVEDGEIEGYYSRNGRWY